MSVTAKAQSMFATAFFFRWSVLGKRRRLRMHPAAGMPLPSPLCSLRQRFWMCSTAKGRRLWATQMGASKAGVWGRLSRQGTAQAHVQSRPVVVLSHRATAQGGSTWVQTGLQGAAAVRPQLLGGKGT